MVKVKRSKTKVHKFQLANGGTLELVVDDDDMGSVSGGDSQKSYKKASWTASPIAQKDTVSLDLAQFSGRLIVRPPLGPTSSTVSPNDEEPGSIVTPVRPPPPPPPPQIQSSPTQDEDPGIGRGRIPRRLAPQRMQTTSEVTLDPFFDSSLAGDSQFSLSPGPRDSSSRLLHVPNPSGVASEGGYPSLRMLQRPPLPDPSTSENNISGTGAPPPLSDVVPIQPRRQVSVPYGLEVGDASSTSSPLPPPPPPVGTPRSGGTLTTPTMSIKDTSPSRPERQMSDTDHTSRADTSAAGSMDSANNQNHNDHNQSIWSSTTPPSLSAGVPMASVNNVGSPKVLMKRSIADSDSDGGIGTIDSVPILPERQMSIQDNPTTIGAAKTLLEQKHSKMVRQASGDFMDNSDDEDEFNDEDEARDRVAPLETQASMRLMNTIRVASIPGTSSNSNGSSSTTDGEQQSKGAAAEGAESISSGSQDANDLTPQRPERRSSVEQEGKTGARGKTKTTSKKTESPPNPPQRIIGVAKKILQAPKSVVHTAREGLMNRTHHKSSSVQQFSQALTHGGNLGPTVSERRRTLRQHLGYGLSGRSDSREPIATAAGSSSEVTVSVSQLHDICGRSNPTLAELEECLWKQPEAAGTVDGNGRLPLHILGDNEALLSTEEGRQVATAFGELLVHSYVPGITTADNEGLFPFVKLIEDWVLSIYFEEYSTRPTAGRELVASGDGSSRSSFLARVRCSLRTRQHSAAIESGNRANVNHNNSPEIHPDQMKATEEKSNILGFSTRACPTVLVWDEVEWALSMLSLVVAELGGVNGGLHQKGVSGRHQIAKDMDCCDKLANHLADKLPTLVKTVLLVEDDGENTRQKLLQLSIFRRCLLCPNVVGPWLCCMLRRKGLPARRAVDFLQEISRTTVEDYVGKSRTPLPDDYQKFGEEKEKVYTAMASMNDAVASIMALDNDHDLKRAASTEIVFHLTGNSLSRPFAVALVLIDLVLHITLMMAFRNDVQIGSDGASTAIGNVPTQVVIYICVHNLIRIASEALSLLSISMHVFRKHFSSIWIVFNLLAIVLTLVATVWNDRNPDEFRPDFNAFVLGLLWVKVLGFLKVINKEMSTFILALIQILKDMRYFMIVLVVVLLMFGDMTHLAVSTKDNGSFCSIHDAAGLLSSPAEDFCSTNARDYYLRMYALLLGDFELDDYRDTPGMLLLFVVFNLIGVVILLNVLIAVISDSYEKASLSSRTLFGIARISFVAQSQALESFLKPNSLGESDNSNADTDGRSGPIYGAVRVFRWVVLVAIISTAMNAELYLTTRAVSLIRADETSVFALAVVVFLSFVLMIALWAILTFAFGLCCKSKQTGINKLCIDYFISVIGERLFGLRKGLGSSNGKDEEEWAGKITHLEHALGRKLEIAVSDMKEEMAELEKKLLCAKQQ